MSSTSIIWIGMDVHKDTVMVAVFKGRHNEPEVVQQLPNARRKPATVDAVTCSFRPRGAIDRGRLWAPS